MAVGVMAVAVAVAVVVAVVMISVAVTMMSQNKEVQRIDSNPHQSQGKHHCRMHYSSVKWSDRLYEALWDWIWPLYCCISLLQA